MSLCSPKDCRPPGSSVHGDSPGKNTRVGCHALLQGIFPTQGSNPGLPHCRQILSHLSHQGSDYNLLTGLLSLLSTFQNSVTLFIEAYNQMVTFIVFLIFLCTLFPYMPTAHIPSLYFFFLCTVIFCAFFLLQHIGLAEVC